MTSLGAKMSSALVNTFHCFGKNLDKNLEGATSLNCTIGRFSPGFLFTQKTGMVMRV